MVAPVLDSYYRDPLATLIQGDCRRVLRELPDESVQCVVTSPPYWGPRDYGVEPAIWGDPDHAHEWATSVIDKSKPGILGSGLSNNGAYQASVSRFVAEYSDCECGAWRGALGLEPSPDMFVAHLVSLLSEARRVLAKDGIAWVVIGDSYNGSGVNDGSKSPGLSNAAKPGGSSKVSSGSNSTDRTTTKARRSAAASSSEPAWRG